MRTYILPLLLMLGTHTTGCSDSRVWDFAQAFRLASTSPLLPTAQAAFASAVHQLGGEVSDTASQTVFLHVLNPPESCPCGVDGMACVNMADRDAILVCPSQFTRFASAYGVEPLTRYMIAHEFGHVLGARHSADKQNVMYPTLSDVGNTSYTLADIKAFCDGGLTMNLPYCVAINAMK